MYDIPALDLPPVATVNGSVVLPGSKSISNRVLLLCALSEGTTTIHDLLDSDDTRVMLDALRQLGCTVQIEQTTATITGLGGRARAASADLFLGNAGTAMRPLAAALAVLGGNYTLHGVPRMHERPIGDLVEALRQLGCTIEYQGTPGYPPLHIGQPQLDLARPISVRGDVSSQFLTALLLALPLVATRDVVIQVVGELISRPYIDITLNLLAQFGITVRREGWQQFTIPAGSQYRSPGTVHIEADASSASYFVALGAIGSDPARGHALEIRGLGLQSIQGDIRFVEAAQAMGALVDSGPNWLRIQRGRWPLNAIDLDCNHMPDAAMTLAVMALYAKGTTVLRNIASWRVKETDRIAAMACELRKLGATVHELPDALHITPPASNSHWQTAAIHTYDDHRVAMCFSLAAFNPAQLPVRIEDPKCVAKTFPDYFESFFSVTRAAQATAIPVICIDGPTASGKGTLAARIAAQLGYHYLDSGALYRLAGLAARRAGLTPEAEHADALGRLTASMNIVFDTDTVWLDGQEVSQHIRTETAGMDASRISSLPTVRLALHQLQLDFQRLPGLVADGRDMGTVIFPKAQLKVFLTATAAERAQRRYKQLISKGISANLDSLRADLEARDARDMSRASAPLKPADDALMLDSSQLSIDNTVDQVLHWWQQRSPFRPA